MRSFYLIARDNESVRLYIGEFADHTTASASLAYNSRDWRVGSI